MVRTTLLLFVIGQSQFSFADFSNFNSILVGDRAAGMGGAYTALSDDAAGSPFYNPASISRMKGSTISASASSYAKFDTRFGDQTDLNSAPLRINQGSIVPIPTASGTVHSFRNFALGLSIVSPDFDAYAGEVRSANNSSSTVNLRDQSLWVGGTLALNHSEEAAFGITMYYTSRSYTRSVTDRYETGGNQNVTSEETYFSNNSLIYILGYYHQINPYWSLGASYRFPSLEVSGRGSYFRSQVNSGGGLTAPINEGNLKSDTKVPDKASLGLAYSVPKGKTYSLDLNVFSGNKYRNIESYGDNVEHKAIANLLFGYEDYVKDWIVLRLGAYTNFSSHVDIPDSPTVRYADDIDQWGWSFSFAFLTGESTKTTVGGYYSGGKGYTVQEIGGEFQRLNKSVQIFTFLVGTSFQY